MSEEEEKQKLLDQLRKDNNIAINEDVDPESGLTMADRGRLSAQGLLFNFSDEIIAGIKALSPNVTYEEAIKDERKELEEARAKKGSLKYELGGAALPAVASVALAPFTGGASLVGLKPTVGRLAGQGAVMSGLYAAGGAEGDVGERLKQTPVAAITGAITNPLFNKLGQAGAALISPYFDKARRLFTGKTAAKVEDEILRMIDDSGLTVDEFLEQASKGKIFPEMSPEAAKVVGQFSVKGGPGTPIIRETLDERRANFIKNVYSSLQEDLAPSSQGGNIFATFSNNSAKLKKAESDAYKEIFDATKDKFHPEIDNIVLSIAQKSRNQRARINNYMQENGFDTIFKVNKKGELELKRSLTLEEGEIVKRAFMDAKNAADRSGKGNLKNTLGGYESEIKKVLDDISPELQNTRKNWATISNSIEKFKEGQKILSKDPEEVAVMFNDLLESGDEMAIEALRAGLSKAFKFKGAGRSSAGMINKLGDSAKEGFNKNEREILEILYPGEKLDDILEKINQAKSTIFAESKIFQGPKTAEMLAGSGRVGTVGQDAANIARVISSGGTDLGATKSLLQRMFGSDDIPFTNDQLKKIGEFVVETDPEVLRRALTNETNVDAVYRLFSNAIQIISSTQPRSLLTERAVEPYSDAGAGALDAIIQTITPNTKEKIISSAK
jgi:hypothetical protein|tara:strand:+ start:5788 stop:7800 length:2013 start_codon:yes stop_codon:yes gene_type:complete